MTTNTGIIDLIIEDSLESIFETLKQAVIAHRDGYRVSINFSGIRSKGDIITSVQKPSEGVVTFLKIFDLALNAINSKTFKDEANIAILNVDHPDILEFLSLESHFNLKVAVKQNFIDAVEHDAAYHLIDPRTGNAVNDLNARSVYDLICERTSKSEESAIIYPKKIDKQETLPFNVPMRAEEIVPPPVVTTS